MQRSICGGSLPGDTVTVIPFTESDEKTINSRPGSLRRLPTLSIIGFVVFIVITGLVHIRALAGLDYAIATAVHTLSFGFLEGLSGAVSIALSAELSVLYGLIASLVLWRLGLGPWSLAPLAFFLVAPLEMGLKAVVDQPFVPSELQRSVHYPLNVVQLTGAFPSGHAVRSGFFFVFLLEMLRPYGARWTNVAGLVLVMLAGLVWFTRIYLGTHWTSDVFAGLILGGATALAVAQPVARRIVTRRNKALQGNT